ncbi:MAG TPA: hypothetical protein VFM18_22005 [Methanosarcina sp.]|nr:hypothetical protein [Methanosarcina sp.]
MVQELPKPTNIVNETSARNQAAMTALLTDTPNNITNDYQAIMAETQQGVSYTKDSILASAHNKQSVSDRQTIMSLLADPSLSLEQKKAIIQGVNSEFAKDTSTIVASEMYKQPSAGENIEQEDVRMTGAEQFRKIREYREEKQAIINRKVAATSMDMGDTTTGFLETALAPFGVNKAGASVLSDIQNALGMKPSRIYNSLLPGYAKDDIIKKLATIPPSEQVAVTQKIADIIYKSNVMYKNDNDYARVQLSRELLDEGGYGGVDKFLDNTSGLLDIIGLGTTVKSVSKRITKLFTKDTVKTAENQELKSVTHSISPVSPMKVAEDANPAKARSMYEILVRSESDEPAKALTGTTRDAAIAENHIAQPLSKDGSVETKLVDPDRNIRVITPDDGIIKELEDTGALHYSNAEKEAAGAKIYNDFRNVKEITPLDNMLQVGVSGDQVSIKALYGTTEGGFLKAEDALNQTKFALRDYGIADRDLTLMKKEGDEYIPITLDEAKGVPGNYVVSLDTKHKIGANEIGDWEKETVKRNFFDRIPFLRSKRSGTVANHILDNASMLSPRYTGAGVVAYDKAVKIDKKLIELHNQFAESYKALGKERQEKVWDYLLEANHHGIELNENQLLGRGFTKEEIDTIATWRKNWDTHFWLENHDLVQTLNHQGYKLLENAQGDKLVAKEISKNRNISKVYDPSLNKVRNIGDYKVLVSASETDKSLVNELDELDHLYDSGGTLAKLRRPIDINGVTVEHIIVRNTPQEYLRGFRDFDQILNYRKGYFQVQYKAPKFVTQVVRDASGNELYTKAVAVAGDTAEAEHIKNRLATTNGINPNDFNIRNDLKDLRVDTDHYWDLNNGSGRVAQKHRGQRLEASSGPIGSFDSQYILDPVESAVRASRSLSSRIATRDFLEASKARAMNQYSDFFPSNGIGGKSWVENSNSLVSSTNREAKDIADARTTVEYINYLQNGYVNATDEAIKSGFNAIANILQGTKAEKAFLFLGSSKPTSFAKNGVFQAYLALNPFRQFFIQGHQAVRLLGYNPTYMLTSAAKDGMIYNIYSSGMKDIASASKEEKSIVDFVKGSGMLDAVDKQNLVRGSIADMVEASNPIKRTIGKALEVPRKLGYDTGERAQLVAHLLAVRDKFIKQGKNLADATVRDEAYSVARALTYDMNFAGDMPYNQNALGLFLQFFQVPHKALLSITNRRVPLGDRMRLAVSDIALFGVPGATAISNLVGSDMLPENPQAREAVAFGLASTSYNAILSKIAGKDINVDFSQLSPYGMDGFAHALHAVTSGGMLEFIQNTPAFTLYIKDGSRTREAFGRMFRAFGVLPTQEGLPKEDVLSVLEGFAEISSGWNNAMKAKIIYEMGKIPEKNGDGVLMENADFTYAVAQLFGFRSQKEILEYAASREMAAYKKDKEDEWKQSYDSYLRILTRDGQTKLSDPESVIHLLGAMRLIYKDDYKAQEWFAKKISQDLIDRQGTLTRRIIEYGGFSDANKELADTRNLKIINEDEYNKALKMHDDLQRQIQNMKEEK